MALSTGRNPGIFLAFALVSLFIPSLTLMAFGSIWLWQQGYLLHWAIGAFGISALIYLWQLYILGPATRNTDKPSEEPLLPAGVEPAETVSEIGWPEARWNDSERRAWVGVREIAGKVQPGGLRGRDDLLNLARLTIERVAGEMHPGERDPLFKFTVPEALVLIERVSGRLRPAVESYVPFSRQITVRQMVRLYGWRSLAGYAGHAYDLWRLVRLANPLTAATHEAREQMTKKLVNWGRDEVVGRLARLYIEEVGRAAIDLYGGRLIQLSEKGDDPSEFNAEAATEMTPASVKQRRSWWRFGRKKRGDDHASTGDDGDA